MCSKKNNVKKRWTEQEDDLLRQWYGKRPAEWIGRLLERSPQAVRYHAWKFRLKGKRGIFTPEEEVSKRLLKQKWNNSNVEHLARRSGFATVRAYIKFLAHKKGYNRRGFLRVVSRALTKREQQGDRCLDWTEQQWASFFQLIKPSVRVQRLQAGANTSRPRKPRRSGWTSEGFGGYIHLKLKLLNKSASWLARKVGISRQAVQLYLVGKHTPRAFLKDKIVGILENATNNTDTPQTTSQIHGRARTHSFGRRTR